MEHASGYIHYIQLSLTLVALVIAFSVLKGDNKQLATMAIFIGFIMMLHISIELFELSKFLYSVTSLLYSISIILIVLVLGKKVSTE